jgi:hypothetical protein
LPAVPAGTQRQTLQHLRHARLHMFLRELALHLMSHASPQSAFAQISIMRNIRAH